MIKHDGIVVAVNGNGTVRVRIVQTSACAACKAKAMCASAESKEKEMDVVMLPEHAMLNNSEHSGHFEPQVKIGDEVVVMVQQKMGWKAVLLAYMLPFAVMMAVVAIGNGLLGIREEVIGTMALCAMGVYYIGLGFFKDKIQKDFAFTAKKKEA
jgi:sigma-E factor negative regulatory protein RseC